MNGPIELQNQIATHDQDNQDRIAEEALQPADPFANELPSVPEIPAPEHESLSSTSQDVSPGESNPDTTTTDVRADATKVAADPPPVTGPLVAPRPVRRLTLRSVVPYFGHTDLDATPASQITPSFSTPQRLSYSLSSPTALTNSRPDAPPQPPPPDSRAAFDEHEHWASERRERELDRRSRELDRREREFERRERELERRQREFEHDKARWALEVRAAPRWAEAVDALRARLDADLAAERRRAVDREAALEINVMRKVNEVLERDRQMYGAMQMSDKEVNEMMETSVGYLMQSVRRYLIWALHCETDGIVGRTKISQTACVSRACCIFRKSASRWKRAYNRRPVRVLSPLRGA